jgi:BASS family bile acid:Na+ symporter
VDGATPAGVSSNLFTYIGHGAVELAVSLTFIHTLLAPLLTPAFTQAMASKFIHVSLWAPVLPMISALLLYAILLGLFSKAAPAVRAHLGLMPVIIGTTTVLIIVNLLAAYALARLARLDDATSRTIMFDTGVYNSGLGAVVAAANFGPFAALPPLLNAIMNLIIGALASSWLQHRPTAPRQEAPRHAAGVGGAAVGTPYERS